MRVLFTGQNRHPALFDETVEQVKLFGLEADLDVEIRWVVGSATPDDSEFAVTRGIGLQESLVRSGPTWAIQMAQLKLGLSDVETDVVVVKTRPDVVLQTGHLAEILSTVELYPHRIWAPFVHATYPGLIADHVLGGYPGAFTPMIDASSRDDLLFGPDYYGAHIRRFEWIWKDSNIATSFLSLFSPHHAGEVMVQRGEFGARHFQELNFVRTKDADTQSIHQVGMSDYWSLVAASISLPKATAPWISRFGPDHEPWIEEVTDGCLDTLWPLIRRERTLRELASMGEAERARLYPVPVAGELQAFRGRFPRPRRGLRTVRNGMVRAYRRAR